MNKNIYEFKVFKNITKEITEDTENGKLTKKVETREPVTIVIKAPNRTENDEKNLVYAVEYSDGVRKGLLTNATVKRNYDKDGYISELEQDILKVGAHLLDIQNEFQSLSNDENKKDNSSERLKELEQDWKVSQIKMQDLQNNASNIFNYTAENFANQKAKLWLTLHLVYINENGELKSIFKGEDTDPKIKFQKKLKHFDALADLDDEFYNKVINKAATYISLWYDGKVNSKEDFDLIEKEFVEAEDAGVEDVENNKDIEAPQVPENVENKEIKTKTPKKVKEAVAGNVEV